MLAFILEYDFVQRALITGLIIGLVSPVIGMFIVARRLSVIGEVLSHMSLSGIALGSMLGSIAPFLQPVSPPVYGTVFAVIGAFLVEWISRVYRDFSEVAIPILLSFGMGFGVLLFSMMDGFNVDFAGYLFGNLLAVTKTDLVMTAVIGAGVMVIISLLYNRLLVITFDQEYAGVIGLRKNLIEIVFVILLSLTISVTVRAVGVLLVSGLMILPVASGIIMANGFKKAMIYSIILSEVSIAGGFVLSYYFNLASGGTIIMMALLILLVVMIAMRMIERFKEV